MDEEISEDDEVTMAIIGFIGEQRQGKTASMVACLSHYSKKKFTILTNIKSLKLPHILLTPKMFENRNEIENLKKKISDLKICIGLSEAHLWLDSRNSQKNKKYSWLITQAGKMMEKDGGHFFYDTQSFDSIDKRLRFNTFIGINVKKTFDKDGNPFFEWIILESKGNNLIGTRKIKIDPSALFKAKLYDTHEVYEVPEGMEED